MFKKRIVLYILINCFLFNQVFGNFIIREIFPNTIDDTNLEYVIIENLLEENNNLKGYILYDKSGKEYIFENEIFIENEEKKFLRSKTKILLNNSNEEIYLKNSSGEIVDSFVYDNTEKGYIYRKQDEEIVSFLYEEENVEEEIIIEEDDVESENKEDLEIDSLEENNFQVLYNYQRPTYLVEKDYNFGTGETIYNCDKDHDECKVNFDFRESFTGSFSESDFLCEIDFGFGSGILTGEENKCNPNTVILPIGEFYINVIIKNENNLTDFYTKNIKIINEEKQIFEEVEKQNEDIKSEIYIHKPKIKIQSGLEEIIEGKYDNEKYICNKKECSVNFIYDDLTKGVNCKWRFYGGVYDDNSDKKCNPSYVKFAPGEHRVKLFVCDKNHGTNCKKRDFYFENIYKPELLKSKIKLQGKIGKDKLIVGNKIFCNGVKKCNLNFSGENSTGEIVSYNWDFGNGETFDSYNPKSIKYGSGEYIVSLLVVDEDGNKSKKVYEVKVSEDKLLQKDLEKIVLENGNILSFQKNKIIVKDYLENLELVKQEKFIKEKKQELKNAFTQTFRKNKNFVSLYGKTQSGSVVLVKRNKQGFIFVGDDTDIFTTKVDEKGKYYMRIEYDKPGRFNLSTFVVDKKLGEIEVSNLKEYEVENISVNNKELTQSGNIIKDEEVKLKISIQGKIGKNKILNGNTITCIKTCSINFDGTESKGDIVSYNWNFGNGKIFSGKNPPYIKYNNFGKYTVVLYGKNVEGKQYKKIFYVNFIDEIKKVKNEEKTSILISPKGKGINEDKEIKEKEKDFGKYFIIFIILLSLSFGVILLRRHKIL